MVSEHLLQRVFRSVLLLFHGNEFSIFTYKIYATAHTGPFFSSPSTPSDCPCQLLVSGSTSVIQIKSVYNLYTMTIFRYGRTYYEEGEFVRRVDAMPDNELEPVVRIEENLGTIEVPCGKVDCRSNCLEYLVRPVRRSEDYALAECKISPLVNIL